jgi:hypothetical protein
MIRSAVLATVVTALATPALAHPGPGTFEIAKSRERARATEDTEKYAMETKYVLHLLRTYVSRATKDDLYGR